MYVYSHKIQVYDTYKASEIGLAVFNIQNTNTLYDNHGILKAKKLAINNNLIT